MVLTNVFQEKGAEMTGLEFTGECFVDGLGGALEKEHRARYEFAKRFCADKRVMDIACGSGYGSDMMVRAGARSVLGVDIDAGNVEHARAAFRHDRLDYTAGDAAAFQPPEPVDLVVSFETIEHITSYRAALKNFFNALVPGGQLLISTPYRPVFSPRNRSLEDRPWLEFHTQEFTADELAEELREAGFDVPEDRIYGQRMQRIIYSRKLGRIYRGLLRPNHRGKGRVRPISWPTGKAGSLAPRYFLLLATRPIV
jgi:SAM-dependent methyltransferase